MIARGVPGVWLAPVPGAETGPDAACAKDLPKSTASSAVFVGLGVSFGGWAVVLGTLLVEAVPLGVAAATFLAVLAGALLELATAVGLAAAGVLPFAAEAAWAAAVAAELAAVVALALAAVAAFSAASAFAAALAFWSASLMTLLKPAQAGSAISPRNKQTVAGSLVRERYKSISMQPASSIACAATT